MVAEAATDWLFVGWGGDVDSSDVTIDVVLNADMYVFAYFAELAPPPPPQYFGAVLIANDGTFLGVVNDDPFDSDSLANPYGTYGNRFGALSIWNRFGTYGSDYSSLSPYNRYTSTPPVLVINGVVYGYVTRNTFLGGIDPNVLAIAIGRQDVVRGD